MKTTFLEFEQPIAELETKIDELRYVQDDSAVDISDEIAAPAEEEPAAHQGHLRQAHARGRSRRWRAIRSGRTRSITCSGMFTDFEELHGDRAFADDAAIVGGLARFNGEPCMVIGHQKGRDTKEKIYRNFGMPQARGLPQGAAPDEARREVRRCRCSRSSTRPARIPGIGAEERGQSEAIGRNLYEMARAARADHRHRDRRGRLGRRARHRGRRRDADAAVRDLLGDLARRLRVDPVEKRGAWRPRRPKRSASPPAA